MSRKYALVIGNSLYEDPALARLSSPEADVHALAAALCDPQIGAFDDVEELLNEPETKIRRAISTFFTGKKPDDLLLLYFSGHGVLDPQGRLFLAVRDTQRQLLKATAIQASFITDDMDSCRSKRQVLILDCCHSGAFARGAKGEISAVTRATFEGNGYGRVVLTASDSTQYALEGDNPEQEAVPSLFTSFLLEGLLTGEADRGGDGWVAVDEWYDYAYEKVLSNTPNQTPKRWAYNTQGELVVARNPRPRQVEPVELPRYLHTAIAHELPRVRLDGIDELEHLLAGSSPGLALAARQALQQINTGDDSFSVRQRAGAVLEAHPAEAAVSQESPPERDLPSGAPENSNPAETEGTPEAPPEQRPSRAEELYQQALAAVQSEDWQQARNILGHLQGEQPGYRDSQQINEQVAAALKQQRKDQARQETEQAERARRKKVQTDRLRREQELAEAARLEQEDVGHSPQDRELPELAPTLSSAYSSAGAGGPLHAAWSGSPLQTLDSNRGAAVPTPGSLPTGERRTAIAA
jgi:hypothetical protein